MKSEKKEYSLKRVHLLPKSGRGREGIYPGLLNEFLEKQWEYALIECKSSRKKAFIRGVRYWINKLGLRNKLMVLMRQGELYLCNKEVLRRK